MNIKVVDVVGFAAFKAEFVKFVQAKWKIASDLETYTCNGVNHWKITFAKEF